MYTSIWMVFPSNSSCVHHTRLSVFLCCRIQLPQQSYFPCFLLHKTSIEYTRLYTAITEVLFYTVEPHIPCNDVFSKYWIVESTPIGICFFILYLIFFYNFEYTPHSISDATWFFGDACVGPPGGIQPERVRRWRALSY